MDLVHNIKINILKFCALDFQFFSTYLLFTKRSQSYKIRKKSKPPKNNCALDTIIVYKTVLANRCVSKQC